MSRLIVKNLPAYLNQQRLREYFETKDGPGGMLTDVKVVLKPDGTSRRFGFIGYKTEAEAEKAKKWFDKTFIDSSRISVTIIDDAKGAPTPRPNKRPRLGPAPTEAAVDARATQRDNPELKGKTAKPQMEEFMQVMQPRNKKGPSWANDPQPSEPVATNVNMRTSTSPGDDRVATDAAPDDTISDLDWLKRRTKNTELTDTPVERAFIQSSDEAEPAIRDERTDVPAPTDLIKETILDTARLFLRNLSFDCTDAELLELFGPFGAISQVHIPLDSASKHPKGVAYVTFAQPQCAIDAYEALDKKTFQGRLLHILPAVDRKGKAEVGEAVGRHKKTLKDDREGKRKAMAGKEFNWSMLYMNSEAVASSIADRMNMSKADILNPDSDNAAVKLALAETHVIQETKSFLESHGVVLASLSSLTGRVPRSDTTILVKNIPYGTTAMQVRELFEPHGELRRVLVPPAGTMAVVEFVHADDGRKAFRAVAYRRMGNSVVYLEKGPTGMFTETDVEPGTEPVTATGTEPVKIAPSGDPTSTEEPEMAAGTTLFVKNLSFATTSERLTQVFRNLPAFAFGRVQMKPDPKRPGERLSMGYGFVGFKTREGAGTAIKSMNNFVLDGHALSVKFAGRGAEQETPAAGDKTKGTTTKMIVKNVPFEASKKDIRELFGAHGQLKSVRLPKKFDHRSRGFAFLEFVTRHEAENAYAALQHTHLLGRHLVLQWAEEGADVDVEELRKKAGVGFGDGKELPGKKRKLELGDDDGMDEEEP